MAYGVTVILTFLALVIFISQCGYVLVSGARRSEKPDTAGTKPLKFGFLLSLAFAFGAAGLPLTCVIWPSIGSLAWLIFPVGLLLSCGWLATIAVFIGRHRKQALWLLVGTPAALFWPLWIFTVSWACTTGRGCL